MAVYVKNPDYVDQLNRAVHNWAAHIFKAAFSNTLPTSSMAVLADIGQIGTGGGYTGGAGGGVTLDSVTLTETAGTARVTIADEVFTASGANVGPFRYVWIYNDTAAGDPLVGYYDYGSSITLLDTESITIDFDPVNGLWQMV